MWRRILPWIVGLLLAIGVNPSKSQEDSLRSALRAVNRLQRDLSDSHAYEEYYSNGDYPTAAERRALERELFDSLQDTDAYSNEPYKWGMRKRFSSSFRERIAENNQKNKKYLTEMVLNRLRDTENYLEEDEDYPELLKELLESYNGNHYPYGSYPRVFPNERYDKRVFPAEYYTNLGYNEGGMRKRNRNSNMLFPQTYDITDDYDQLQENVERPNYSQYYEMQKLTGKDGPDLSSYSMKKRFRVAKRSSPVKKDTSKSAKTDPKVEEDLNNIFRKVKKGSHTSTSKKLIKNESAVNSSKETSKSEKKDLNKKTTEKPKDTKKETKELNKETVPVVPKEKPLQLEKKSINWSDYFGIDKRKKSDDFDNEWLMERYHKAVAMASKRDSETPLKNFQKETDPEFLHSDNTVKDATESSINKVDKELKNFEDSIIDDTLKYTGAHEGEVDSKEVQELKDRVISQLAAAYNLEKMRQALGNYKMSISKQRDKMRHQGNQDDFSHTEEKRLSVPRKQAIDDEKDRNEDKDNEIKCTGRDENCLERTYKTPSDVFDKLSWNKGQCSKVEKACKEVAEVLGTYGQLIESACNFHQTCLLCNDNNWFSPVHECNVLFLAKVDDICFTDYECQKIARQSIRYLLSVNRSLKLEPSDDCDMYCPDNRT